MKEIYKLWNVEMVMENFPKLLLLLLIHTFSAKSAIDISNANSARGHKEVRRSTWSHHGGSPLLKPIGIQIATKPLPGPTNREDRKLIGVKTMSLGTN